MSKKHRGQGQREEPRQEPKSDSLDDVTALIKERKKYVDWIAALDAKRAQTPEQAFVRVRLDYQARLDAVDAKLETHRGSLAQEQINLRKRLKKLEEEIQEQEDERAEIDLRAHVGELSSGALADALRQADRALERLGADRISIETDLDRVDEFFTATAVPAAPTSAHGPARSNAANFDELSFLHSVVGAEQDKPAAAAASPRPKTGETKAVQAKPADPRPADEKASETKPSDAAHRESKPGESTGAGASQKSLDLHQGAAAKTDRAKSEVEAPRRSPEKPAVAETKPAAQPVVEKAVELTPVPPARHSIAMHMASMTIEPPVEPPRGSGIVKANESAPSLLDGISPASTLSGQKPFAANVASNNPLSLKSTGPNDLKTLKCRECDAMNDPSEWYCERCGAELSAM